MLCSLKSLVLWHVDVFWPSGPPYFHVLSIAKYLLLLLHLARCRWRRFFRCLKLPSQTRCWCRRDSLCSPRTPKTCGTECFIFAKHTGISSTWTKKLRIMERVHYIHSLFMDPSRDGCTCCCTSCCRRFLGWWSSTLCQTPRILWVLLSCLLTGKGHFTRRKKNQDYYVVLTGCDEHFGDFVQYIHGMAPWKMFGFISIKRLRSSFTPTPDGPEKGRKYLTF